MVSSKPGISGDRTAILVELPNGKFWVMSRCGNPVYIKKPKLPEGDTDQHPFLKPKSKNLKDYRQPGDDKSRDSGVGTKKKARVITPPEKTPPPIVKEIITVIPSRGNTVIIDTPTKSPGSETAVTAPGAVPVVSNPTTLPTVVTPLPQPEGNSPTGESTNKGMVSD